MKACRYFWCAALLVGVSLSVGSGCASMRHPKFHKNIVQIATFVDKRNPWLNFDDPPRDVPGGIKIPMYLVALDRPLGVFGDGSLQVDMYRVDRAEDGSELPVHLKRWTYSAEEAFMYGTRKEQRVGWAYQLRLNWGDLDVLEKEVMFIVTFHRHDGRAIRGDRIYFKVPREV